MKTITDFIDSLFLGIAETSETRQLKEDLLANAEDRYEDLLSQGKTEHEAIGTVISEFGTIDELMEEMNLKNEFFDEKGYELDEITVDEGLNYLQLQRKAAIQIGLGVMIILLGLSSFLGTIAFFGENFGEWVGLIFVFIGAAIGVPLFIIAGMSLSNANKRLNDRFIPHQVKQEVRNRRDEFQRSFVFCMSGGVILCILSLVPVILFSDWQNVDFLNESFGVSLMFLLAAVGVFLFIFGGMIMGSFTKLIDQKYFISDEDELGPRAKAERDLVKPVWVQNLEKVYWPIVVLIFFFQSFIRGNWGTSWIIFPIAGILFSVITNAFRKEDK